MLTLLPFLIAVVAQTVTVTDIRYIPPEVPQGNGGGQGEVTITKTFVITGALPTFEPVATQAPQAPQQQPQASPNQPQEPQQQTPGLAPQPAPSPQPQPEQPAASPQPEPATQAPADTQPAPDAATQPAPTSPQPDANVPPTPANPPVTVITVTGPIDNNALSSLLYQPTALAAGPAGPNTDTAPTPATANKDALGPAGPNPTTEAPATTNPKDLGPAGPNPTDKTTAPASAPAPSPAKTTALQTPASGGGIVRPAVGVLLVCVGAVIAV
ncbi:hypothetical protein CspHIS471_0410640 [Cutaneotrichosporon sp. HIS471]|nr:hypothetical protein CspHIS471_0410640 [Cutaneotrichosporon sp. HIS471]